MSDQTYFGPLDSGLLRDQLIIMATQFDILHDNDCGTDQTAATPPRVSATGATVLGELAVNTLHEGGTHATPESLALQLEKLHIRTPAKEKVNGQTLNQIQKTTKPSPAVQVPEGLGLSTQESQPNATLRIPS